MRKKYCSYIRLVHGGFSVATDIATAKLTGSTANPVKIAFNAMKAEMSDSDEEKVVVAFSYLGDEYLYIRQTI